MIAQLRGKVFPGTDNSLIVDVSGVGYEVICSETTKQDLLMDEFAQVLIHTNVREDAITLFGFSTSLEKQLFLSLIKVNGIGPKMASGILSATSINHLTRYIEEGDVKGLSSLPKIGKKKAEQIILSLKGKLVLSDEQTDGFKFSARNEICSALINLGFKPNDVTTVVDGMDPKTDVQTGVKEGLTQLSQF